MMRITYSWKYRIQDLHKSQLHYWFYRTLWHYRLLFLINNRIKCHINICVVTCSLFLVGLMPTMRVSLCITAFLRYNVINHTWKKAWTSIIFRPRFSLVESSSLSSCFSRLCYYSGTFMGQFMMAVLQGKHNMLIVAHSFWLWYLLKIKCSICDHPVNTILTIQLGPYV